MRRGEHRQRGKHPAIPAQRQEPETKGRHRERGGELPGERKVPTAATVSEAARRAASAHQPKAPSGKGGIGMLDGVSGDSDLHEAECRGEAKDNRDELEKARLGERAEQVRRDAGSIRQPRCARMFTRSNGPVKPHPAANHTADAGGAYATSTAAINRPTKKIT